MQNVSSLSRQIHLNALELSTKYKKVESDLIDVLQQVEAYQVYLEIGYSSLYQYVLNELKLSESVSYNLISVARKARQIPELKAKLKTGELTLSNARMISPIINDTNKTEWLQKAATLSKRQLEREIITNYPKASIRDKAVLTAPDRIRLEVGISENLFKKLKRAQDLLSQARQRSFTLEETIEQITDDYLKSHDPIEKAKRFETRVKAKEVDHDNKTSKIQETEMTPQKSIQTLYPHVPGRVAPSKIERTPLSAKVKHLISLRDQRQCTYILPNGLKCQETRFIEVHHKKPVSEGGTNELQNLATLCSSHHKGTHRA